MVNYMTMPPRGSLLSHRSCNDIGIFFESPTRLTKVIGKIETFSSIIHVIPFHRNILLTWLAPNRIGGLSFKYRAGLK